MGLFRLADKSRQHVTDTKKASGPLKKFVGDDTLAAEVHCKLNKLFMGGCHNMPRPL